MSDYDSVIPNWDDMDVPEDDSAEPADISVEHEMTPDEVQEAIESPEPSDEEESSDEAEETEALDVSQYHTENGWYQIPGREKAIRGEEAARKALAKTKDKA